MDLTDMLSEASAFAAVPTAKAGAEICCTLDSSMSAFPAETPVGMAYVPYQKWKNVYEPSVALVRGTVFEDLDKPFLGEKAV